MYQFKFSHPTYGKYEITVLSGMVIFPVDDSMSSVYPHGTKTERLRIKIMYKEAYVHQDGWVGRKKISDDGDDG